MKNWDRTIQQGQYNSFTHFGVDRWDGTKEIPTARSSDLFSSNELWFLETERRLVNYWDTKNREDVNSLRGDATVYLYGAPANHTYMVIV